MGKHKDKKKESQLVIRVEKDEKAAFLSLCKTLDSSAGREIRRFMRDAVAAQAQPTPVTETAAQEAAPEAPPEASPVPPEAVKAPQDGPAEMAEPEPAKTKAAKAKAERKVKKTAE